MTSWGLRGFALVLLVELLACGKSSLVRNLPSLLTMYLDVLAGKTRSMSLWTVTRGCWMNIVMQFFGQRKPALAIAASNKQESQTVAIVTGATGGIGVTTTEALMSAGVHVIIAVRDLAKGESLLKRLLAADPNRKGTVLPLNVADLKSVEAFVPSFQSLGLPVHILVNNAGVMALPSYTRSPDGVEMQFATNYLGHFHLTSLLLPLLEQCGTAERPARVVNVSSSMHSFMSDLNLDDIKQVSDSMYSPIGMYSISKAAQILHVVDLNRRLQGRHVKAFALHPGVIATNLLANSAGVAHALDSVLFHNPCFRGMIKTVDEGASTTVYAALDPAAVDDLSSGSCYFNCNGPASCCSESRDPLKAAALWDFSESMIREALGRGSSSAH